MTSDNEEDNDYFRVISNVSDDEEDSLIRKIISDDEEDNDHIRKIRMIRNIRNLISDVEDDEDDEDDNDHIRQIRVLRNLMSDDDDDDKGEHIHLVDSAGTKSSDKKEEKENEDEYIRVVAAIDFGTTYSGFAYAYKSDPSRIIVHNEWQEFAGVLTYKTPTVLKYDESLNVISWGYSALAGPESSNKKDKKNKNKNKKQDNHNAKLAGRFKLHLSKMEDKKKKIYLPDGLDYKTAIIDYLKKMREVIVDTLESRGLIKKLEKSDQEIKFDFFKQVLIIMTIPAEFDERAIRIMRECADEADLIEYKDSPKLKFTTEPEAAAVNCMSILKELDVDVGKSFMVVDCGGGTVDLTTRRLLEGDKLGETVKRKGGYCGGSFVDEEFIKFLSDKIGQSAIDSLMKDNQLQYTIQEFCRRIKHPFTGHEKDFKPFDMDLEELCPDIKEYVKNPEFDKMEEEEWIIEMKFEDVKKMFDPVIKDILDLIEEYLNEIDKRNVVISAMLLVGGFSESKYLRERVKQKFNDRLQNKISFPERPITAIVEGAVRYGLKQDVIATRVIKWTYGTDVAREWRPSDPEHRKIPNRPNGMVIEFSRLAECGKEIPVNSVIQRIFSPGCIFQGRMGLDIYITDKNNADYCDTPEVKKLDNWSIKLPITLGPRPILFLLIFGEIEIRAIAINLITGKKHKITYNRYGDI